MLQDVSRWRAALLAVLWLAAGAAAAKDGGVFSGKSDVRVLVHTARSSAAPTIQRVASLRQLAHARHGLTPQQSLELLFVGRDLMLHDPSPAVRKEAIGMFAAIAVASEEARLLAGDDVAEDIADLAAIAAEEETPEDVRVAAVKALRRLDADLAVFAAVAGAGPVQRSAETLRAVVVGAAATAGASAVPLIAGIARTAGDDALLASSAFALGETGSASAIPELLRLRGHEAVRVSAVDALVKLGPQLLSILADPADPQVLAALAAVEDLWVPELRASAMERVVDLVRNAPADVAREAVRVCLNVGTMETAAAERALLTTVKDIVKVRGDLEELASELENRAGSIDLVPAGTSDVAVPAREVTP